MKKLALLLAVIFTLGGMVAACGSDDEGPLNKEELVAAADQICEDNDVLFDRLGTRGLTNPGLAAEFEGSAAVRQQFVSDFRELDVDKSVETDWQSYVDATEEMAEAELEIAAAGAADDTDGLNEGFAKLDKKFTSRDKLADEIGFQKCGQDIPIDVVKTGTGPAEDVKYAEPENTVDEAADAYLKAVLSGDCEAADAERHTDAKLPDPATCKSYQASFKGGEVAGAEQYGPVGTASIIGAGGVDYSNYFVLDLDGNLRSGGDAINDYGGLRPAAEGNDADESAAGLVTAMRDGDAEAFNALIAEPEDSAFQRKADGFDSIGSSKYGSQFVKDIRNSDAVAQPLGINSSYAFYQVPGSKYDWAMVLIHTPGDKLEYRLAGFFPMPKPT